ncbi:hypothetical protein FO519_007058 [Halicephalobus sp. NKZ332]|nr:hypothetical protein FO519_007058 [Halicephalobus sp. NKZ332]
MAASGAGDAADPIDYGSLFEVNPDLLNPEFVENVRDTLAGKTSDSKPFPHISLENFLTNPRALDCLREELGRAKWTTKATDLYSMKRTTELINFDATVFPALKAFRRFLTTKGREFMMKLTGVDLNGRVDVAGSCYEESDVLLPHDDRMEERKFAFMLYLTPEWEEEWGGQLVLFNSDEKHYPTNVAKKIAPKLNNFLFFNINHEIGHTSWHCVEEVIAPGKKRLSLNGWFHIDDIGKSRALPRETELEKILPSLNIDYEDVRAWINPIYIASSEQKAIKKLFASKSELALCNFLTAEKYAEALQELKSAEYVPTGPPNLRLVERLDESKLPEKSAIISFVNKMNHGCYSLCDDQMAADALNNGFCFDLLLFFMDDQEWNKDAGGYLSYIAANDPNEILRVDPVSNGAAFVFREPEVLNFTKYLNSKCGKKSYFVLNCSYYSNSSGDSETESSEEVEEEEYDDDSENYSSEPKTDYNEESVNEFKNNDDSEVDQAGNPDQADLPDEAKQ